MLAEFAGGLAAELHVVCVAARLTVTLGELAKPNQRTNLVRPFLAAAVLIIAVTDALFARLDVEG